MTRRSLATAEHGFSMIAVMLVMLITSIIAGAAFAAVGGDIPFARAAQDRKQAYAAAEAGVQYYLYQLSRDNDYWTRCDDVPDPAPGQASPVTLPGDPRVWRRIPAGEGEYSIELLPAPGATECDPAAAQSTMLDQSTGTFRIRSTGRSRGIRRSVIATFRRSSFLDYLYFTDFETSDPQTYSSQQERTWADANCVRPRAQRHRDCVDITFPTFDGIKGPFHTNDDILTCGNPKFGRDPATRPGKALDRIEISGPAPNGWAPNNCGGTPTFYGTKVHPAATLTIPPSNNVLESVAQSGGVVFSGRTSIVFDGSPNMRVRTGPSQTETTVPLPRNGVIYVRTDGGCSPALATPVQQTYGEGRGCAVVSVSGTYPRSMTIASQADIVIPGNLEKANDAVLGLIANNFVRVRHPVNRSGNSCSNAGGTLQDVKIEAAILTLAHSFIVDNHSCGARLGTLTVTGAIAQKFRGPVGTFNTSSGQGVTGYTKNYEYDDRLKYRSPPYFLDPISAAWRVIRANEQVPAEPG
jgi:type II secretory pathway pseudopilin PulG